MPLRGPVNQAVQRKARHVEARLSQDGSKYFLGRARINIDVLDFSRSSAREIDPANVQRLVSHFRLVGCLRLDSRYHVPAIVDNTILRQALEEANASVDDLRSSDTSRWPFLTFPAGARIDCLHGQHRVMAARVILPSNERWWIADLYSDGKVDYPLHSPSSSLG